MHCSNPVCMRRSVQRLLSIQRGSGSDLWSVSPADKSSFSEEGRTAEEFRSGQLSADYNKTMLLGFYESVTCVFRTGLRQLSSWDVPHTVNAFSPNLSFGGSSIPSGWVKR